MNIFPLIILMKYTLVKKPSSFLLICFTLLNWHCLSTVIKGHDAVFLQLKKNELWQFKIRNTEEDFLLRCTVLCFPCSTPVLSSINSTATSFPGIFCSQCLFKKSTQLFLFVIPISRCLIKLFLNFYSVLVILLETFLLMSILSNLSLKNVRRIRAVPCRNHHRIRAIIKTDFEILRGLYAYNINYIICSIFCDHQCYSNFDQSQSNIDTIRTGIKRFFSSSAGIFIYYIYYCTNFFIE